MTSAGLAGVTYFSSGSLLKSLLMAAFGLVLGCVGKDPMTLKPRMTFGFTGLLDGIELPALAIGLFGLSEILLLAQRSQSSLKMIAPPRSLLGFLPNREETRRSVAPVARGTVLGFLVGVLPGGGAVIASFLSYALEKKLTKQPEEFGKGAVEGLAGPETANNAASSGSLLPPLCMELPAKATTAVLLNAFILHGVAPGPAMMTQQPEIFWGLIASMYIGNVMLLVLSLLLIGLMIRTLDVPRAYLGPIILLFCMIGVYSSVGDASGVLIAVVFGFVGYYLRQHGFNLGMLILAFVLGPILERSVRQALNISDGEFGVFVASPISITLLCVAAAILLVGLWPRRPVVNAEDD